MNGEYQHWLQPVALTTVAKIALKLRIVHWWPAPAGVGSVLVGDNNGNIIIFKIYFYKEWQRMRGFTFSVGDTISIVLAK